MLVEVGVWRVLEAPLVAANHHPNDPVVTPGRLTDPALVTLVLHAESTLWVLLLGIMSRCRNRLRILFRLRQVNGDLQVTVLGWLVKDHVLFDGGNLDVVVARAQVVEPVRGRVW